MEAAYFCATIEQARNDAVSWLEARGASFDGYRAIEIGRLGLLENHEVGVSSTRGTYWRIRLDYDELKAAHFNVEFGKGAGRQKAAFCFPGGEALIQRLAHRRHLR